MFNKTTTCLVIFIAIILPLKILAKEAANPQIPPAYVEVTTAKATTTQQHIQAVGTLNACKGITLSAEMPGTVSKIHVKSGQMVKVGQLLLELNPDALKAQLKQDQANVKLSHLNYNRAKKLYQQRTIARADLDKATANYTAAQGALDETQAQLNKVVLHAPFTGKLGLIKVSLGDYAQIGQPLVNLQELDPLRVDFSVPQVYLAQLQTGQQVSLQNDAYPKQNFIGKIYAKDSLIDANTRSIAVRASIVNKRRLLLPGMFVTVNIALGKPQQTIKIPQTAIIYTAKANYIYKLVNKQPQKIPVKLGQRDQSDIIIESGIKVGDVIITAGQNKILPGAPLIVVDHKA